jgi:hypothetical protein
MPKQEFLQKVRTAWNELENIVSGVQLSLMDFVHSEGNWTIKDILAHVTWYETEMVDLLSTHVFGGSELWDLPLQPRNTAIFTLIKDRELEAVISEFYTIHAELMKQLENLNDDELTDPRYFTGMPSDWQPWQVIDSNTSEHYPEHVIQIKEIMK